jgi:hypothetical protein
VSEMLNGVTWVSGASGGNVDKMLMASANLYALLNVDASSPL